MLQVDDVVRIVGTDVEGVIDQVSSQGDKILYYRVIVGGNMETMKLYEEGQIEFVSRPKREVY